MAKVLIFRLRELKQPFSIKKNYDIEKDLKYIKWSADMTSFELSETLNNQVILNMSNFRFLSGTCKRISDRSITNPNDIFTLFVNEHGDLLLRPFGIKDMGILEDVCKKYSSKMFEKSQWDVLSRDHDALNHVSEYRDLHAVVLLDKNNEYTGHIYTWLSPDEKHLIAIGIRSRIDMLFERSQNRGMNNVADYLLEALRLLALRFGAVDIIIPKPLKNMQILLIDRYHFQTQTISVEILKSPMLFQDPFINQITVYTFNKLDQPITLNMMSLTIIA
jgi:hypothetical protein